ncbi:MAG TPA: hypothetical protein VHE37_02865 [Nevskiaceae bacterium]|nr:hypothetical protein [Nevskiaceae bacterium]
MGLNVYRCGLASVLIAAAVSGCSSSDSPAPAAAGGGGSVSAAPVSRYDMANRCFVLRANGGYAGRNGGSFVASATSASGAEHFFMKPAGLGRYVFYTSDQLFMTASGTAVSAADAPGDGSDWTVDGDNGVFTASTLGQKLALDSSGNVVLGDTAALLTFEPASGCTDYPEMPVDVDSPTFKSNPVGRPVIGFAEVHSHMGMGSEMSDGANPVGPSAGGVMYGQAINRFGVIEALKDCSAMHGPDGVLSPENIILDQQPLEHHQTKGWPTFVDWPKNNSELHQQMYYRWVERAYRAGLRTMVIHGTNIEALCDIAKATVGDKNADCADMSVGEKQVKYLTGIQDYVDAQEGGPGKGWFRIIKDPAEARGVISEGKLAVIPGLEFSNLFHCNVTFNPLGGETSACTKDDIDAGVEEAWNLGVREVFPFHDVDSALGGTGIFSSILDYVGFVGTHGFWKMYPCPDVDYFTGEGVYVAGAEMQTASLTQFNDPITQAIIQYGAGILPVYGPGRQCNARNVTDLGKYAIDKIMKKGFVLDIDHAELASKQYMLDQGARTTPYYPMVSGHGGHGGITTAQATQIIKQGGIIYPALPNGKDFARFIQQIKPVWAASGTTRPLAVGYGADSNGLRDLPGPRGAGSKPIPYPFTLFQGDGWGPEYAAAGIAPIKIEQLSIPGGRSWNMDEEGMSHYGLVPDIVEEISIEGGAEATSALYRSSEAYLELWEQTLQAAASARQLPSP